METDFQAFELPNLSKVNIQENLRIKIFRKPRQLKAFEKVYITSIVKEWKNISSSRKVFHFQLCKLKFCLFKLSHLKRASRVDHGDERNGMFVYIEELKIYDHAIKPHCSTVLVSRFVCCKKHNKVSETEQRLQILQCLPRAFT